MKPWQHTAAHTPSNASIREEYSIRSTWGRTQVCALSLRQVGGLAKEGGAYEAILGLPRSGAWGGVGGRDTLLILFACVD